MRYYSCRPRPVNCRKTSSSVAWQHLESLQLDAMLRGMPQQGLDRSRRFLQRQFILVPVALLAVDPLRSSVDQLRYRQLRSRGNSHTVSSPQLANQLIRRTHCQDAPLVHDGHSPAESSGLLHVVRRQHDGLAFSLNSPDQVPQVVSGTRVEASCRLIQYHQLRVVHQGSCKGEGLLLTTGQPLEHTGASLVETDFA